MKESIFTSQRTGDTPLRAAMTPRPQVPSRTGQAQRSQTAVHVCPCPPPQASSSTPAPCPLSGLRI
jgi:hypothetical protein